MKEKILNTGILAAKKAGALLRKHHDETQKISLKGEVNLVTELDKLSEKTIIETIRSVFDDHSILSEEVGELNSQNAIFKWIIDPLDGTTNYAHGFPYFCVSIAVEKEGEVYCGIVYQPLLDELFTAIKGEGAYKNNFRIYVSQRNSLNESLLATGFPYDLRNSDQNNIKHFNNFILKTRAVRRAGAAALDLSYVGMGRLDGFWEPKLSPWDVAAGSLIIKEAGGTVTDFEGKEFNIYYPNIVASNGKIHKQILEVIQNNP